MVKKIFKILFIFLFIWLTISTIHYLFFWGKLGKGYYIYDYGATALKCNRLKLHLTDIKDWEYTEKYIVVKRIPDELYTCNNGESHVFYNNQLQYLIIDKNTDKIYTTYNKDKFLELKDKFGIKKEFTIDNNKLLNSMKNSQNMYNNIGEDIEYIKKHCKKYKEYPIVEY